MLQVGMIDAAAKRTLQMRAGFLGVGLLLLAGCSNDRLDTTGSIGGSPEPVTAAPSGRITRAPLAAPDATRSVAAAPSAALPGSAAPRGAASPNTAAPNVDMAGRWFLAADDGRRCGMNFGAPGRAGEGSIAPESGCPGQFFTSRRWLFDQGSLLIRDHNGAPLAQLAMAGAGHFDGTAVDGQHVSLAK
jgi:Protease inhibitor Inh